MHSDLRIALQKIGKPIPPNDLWQVAIAIQHDAVLVTNDRHFAVVPGLRTAAWTA
jgi:predicted nucleic acid-binding protein